MSKKMFFHKNKRPDWHVDRGRGRTGSVRIVKTKKRLDAVSPCLDKVLLTPDVSDIPLTWRQKQKLRKGKLDKCFRSMNAEDALRLSLKVMDAENHFPVEGTDRTEPIVIILRGGGKQALRVFEEYTTNMDDVRYIFIRIDDAVSAGLEMIRHLLSRGDEESLKAYKDIQDTLFERLPRIYLIGTNERDEEQHYICKGPWGQNIMLCEKGVLQAFEIIDNRRNHR